MERKYIIPKDKLEQLITEGKTLQEMADLLGCSKSTIKNRLRLYKLKCLSGRSRGICKECGAKLHGNQIFYCSKTCKTKWFLKNHSHGPNDKNLCYQSDRGRKRKFMIIKERGGSCEICGYNKNLAALCFHHKDNSDKVLTLHSRMIGTRSMDVIQEEANKCLILCHNCHMELHNQEWDMDTLSKLYNL